MDAARAQSQILPQMPDVPVTDHWTLHCGRAQDVLPGEYAGRVNLIVTSPPYDGLRDFGHSDAWDFDAVASAIIPALALGGVLVWVVADAIVDGSESASSFRQALHFLDAGLFLHQTLVYENNHFIGTSPNRYARTTQWMFVLSNGRPATANLIRDRVNSTAGTVRHYSSYGREGDNHLRLTRHKASVTKDAGIRSAVWRYKVGYGQAERRGGAELINPHQHPAIFPYGLAADHIRTWTNPGDLVLDPMAGSGTTLRAAVDLNRRAVGVEVNPDYCDLIRRRMAQQTLGL